MNFNFQEMKPHIQADFDRILDHGPVDLTNLIQRIPVGADPYLRKLTIIEAAAEECPVQLFDHYPFAFKLIWEKKGTSVMWVSETIVQKKAVLIRPLWISSGN